MEEKIINFGKRNSLVGVYTEAQVLKSQKNICLILLNAGLIHKVGPNRVYVEISRKIAQKGISSFRFDFSGVGDSVNLNGNDSQGAAYVKELELAMDIISDKGECKFIIVGICSGASNAFKAAGKLIDKRIAGLILIDGIFHEQEVLADIAEIAYSKCARRYYKKNIFNLKRWIKVFTGKSKVFRNFKIKLIFQFFFVVIKILFRTGGKNGSTSLQKKPSKSYEIDNWQNIFKNNTKVLLVFSEGSPMIDIYKLTIANRLNLYEDNKYLKQIMIKDTDHTFTPKWSQLLLINLIEDFVLGI